MSTKNHVYKFLILLLLVCAALYAGRYVGFDAAPVQAWLAQYPLWLSGGLFMVVYVVASTLVWIGPKDVMKLVGLALFGPWISAGLIWLAEMMNAVVLFTLARRLGEGFVRRRIPQASQRVNDWIAAGGVWGIFVMRLSIVPFRFLDLGCGLTRLPLRRYLMIAALGSPLRIVLIQYVLSFGVDILRDPLLLSERLLQDRWLLGMSVVYLAAAAGILVFLGRRDRGGA